MSKKTTATQQNSGAELPFNRLIHKNDASVSASTTTDSE